MIALPKDDVEKQMFLSQIAKKFRKDTKFSEEQVTLILKSFGIDDYALIRRELVNFNYFGKDSYKGLYWIKKFELSDAELEQIKNNQFRVKNFS
jgi:hypothetical protein